MYLIRLLYYCFLQFLTSYCCLLIALMFLDRVDGRAVSENLKNTENSSLIKSDKEGLFTSKVGENVGIDQDLEMVESRFRKKRRGNHNVFARVRWNWSIVPESEVAELSIL